jgi:hypothetical protein
MSLPIEIVNKILIYVGELNNDIIILQYSLIKNTEYYNINFHSDFLWKIKANLLMKTYYPIYSNFFSNKTNMDLYNHGTRHYVIQLSGKQ